MKDWEDTNGNRRVDDQDDFSGPYWIQITGFPSGSYADSDTTWTTWLQDRYLTEEAAADAAGTAIGFAWQIGIPGVIPTADEVRGWTVASVEDPYNREIHFGEE